MDEHDIKELARNGVYLGRTLGGKLEETHISWVILTTRFAFKIKKPLKLSFLDFSSLTRRKKYCEKEIKLNRRFSDIYLAVVPVKFNRGRWFLGRGKGKIVDYAVQMKRMKSGKRMDSLLQARKVSRRHMLSLAAPIASFHSRAAIMTSPFDLQFARKNFNDIEVIQAFTSKALGKRFANILTKAIIWNNSFLHDHEKRFHERVLLGFKRDLHGDLHSGNIFLYSKPVIFDCIEFNDAFRQIDVIDEIAFFCMDLETYGGKRLSEIFIKEYTRRFACFETEEDEDLFIYYKCYRANVRAKVHALAAQQEDDIHLYQKHLQSLKDYLLLMNGYFISQQRGMHTH